jgi:hypothetical protein
MAFITTFPKLTFIDISLNLISGTLTVSNSAIDDVERARRVIVGTGGKRLCYQRPASEANV